MTTPTLESTVTASGFGGGGSSATKNVTTTTANLLTVIVFAETSPAGLIGAPTNPVVSVTAAGLTFTRYTQVARNDSYTLNFEVWSAPLFAPLTAWPVTITMSDPVDTGLIVLFGVKNCDPLNPFDSGVGTLPASVVTGAGSPTVSSYQTTRSNDLLLYLFGIESFTINTGGAPAGYTEIGDYFSFVGGKQVHVEVAVDAPGAIIPGAIFVSPAAGGTNSLMLLMAFQGPSVTVTVPNVVGDSLSVAGAALIAADLQLGLQTFATSFTVADGLVISQSPSAGATALGGDAVALILSLGLPPLWTISPDWQTPVREKLGFLTDVLPAWTASEQRRSLRIAPRRVFSFSTLASFAEKRYIENALFAWAALVWYVPIFPDGQHLTSPVSIGDTTIACDTVDRDFVAGGVAIVIADAQTIEVLQISTVASNALNLSAPVTAAHAVGMRLYPLRRARLLAFTKLAHDSQQTFSLSIDFTIDEPCDWPAASGLPAYRTLPVLEDSPDVSSPPSGDYTRDAHIIDSSTGAISVIDTALLGFPGTIHEWFLKGRTARSNFRKLLYLLKGRAGMIWVPSYNADLMLLESLGSAAVAMTVEAVGLPTLGVVQNRRDIRIELTSGTIYYRRIVSAAAGSPGQEVATIDSALGATVTPAQIRRISFMALSRLDADEIEIQHLSMADGVATAQTPFRAFNYEPV